MATEATTETSQQAIDALRAALRLSRRRALKPPPSLTVPEWADQFRRLAKEAGSTGGRWQTSRVEAARGPMMAVTEPGVRTITLMCCTQLTKTALIENVFGYFAHLDPAPMLLIQPKDEAVQAFSKERIGPLIKATPALRELMGDRKTRTAEDTLAFKAFPGGFLAMVAAGSPTNLAMRPIRVTLADEVDKYVPTKEGDPLDLAEERTATFAHNSLSIRACSPTDEYSRIAASYEASDQRRAAVVCPHCGHLMFPDFFGHVHWDKTGDGDHLTDTARLCCEACGAAWEEPDRLRALQTVRWFQTKPFTCCGQRHDPLTDYARFWRDGADDAVGLVWRWDVRNLVGLARCRVCDGEPVSNRHAGFQASKLFSPWRPIPEIAAKWIASKGNEDKRQAFYNTQLGVPYRRQVGKEIKPDRLMVRREVYQADVPDGVAVLTCGVDTQGDRLEAELVGWGRDEESWSVAYEVFAGDPAEQQVWERLDEWLQRHWLRSDGRPFTVEAVCVDSGGHHTQRVYDFCRSRANRKVWAIKGASEVGGRSPIWPVIRLQRGKRYKPVMIGTNAAKDAVSANLNLTTPGPGYCHFPANRAKEWFEQLTGEIQKTKVQSGRTYRVWVALPGRRTEALDCRVYALAALKGLEHHGLKLNHRADAVGATSGGPVILAGTPEAERLEQVRETEPVVEMPVPPKPKRWKRRPVARSSWMAGG